MDEENVIPLRTGPRPRGEPYPKSFPRVISHLPGLIREALVAAYRDQEQHIERYEARLSALVAKTMMEKLPPVELWVAAILTSQEQDEDTEGDVVELAPREQAVEVTEAWSAIHDALLTKPLSDRLDIVVEAGLVVGLVSFDIEPALPVTRKQAESINLPPHLLFAKGEAFASVGDEPASVETLQAAWSEHKRLLEEQSDELLHQLRSASVRHSIEELSGVVLALGPDGNAVSAVTREQALKVVLGKPFLERKLLRPSARSTLKDGRDLVAIPIVVWAKGHVAVQARDVVEV